MKPNCSPELQSLLGTAVNAATDAGDMLASAFKSLKVVNDDSGRDIKLEMDVKSEQLIVRQLTSETPYAVFAEESGDAASGTDGSELKWIVDPLDGTLNYHREIPLCCVSIALFNGSEPILGVIHDFNRKTTYSGAPGLGAWINDSPMHVSKTPAANKAILCTGFPVATDFSSAAVSDFVKFVQSFKKVRLLGSAALSLAFTASGKADAYCEQNIKLWDIAAGAALVRAAGGHVDIQTSDRPEIVTVFASNGRFPKP